VTWKDLPSENWAEMMDFWHCHKPTEHESHAGHSDEETATANKGYAANSKFTAQNKVGFVDLTTFLLDAKDCNNIRVSLCLYFPIILLFFHFFGITWVSRRWLSPAIATRWHGHRYKHPIATPCPIRFGGGWLSLPLSSVFFDCGLDGPLGIYSRLPLRIFLEIMEGHGINTRDILH